MKTVSFLAAVLAMMMFTGCATKVYVTELSAKTEANTRVDGVPFRVLENYRVRMYEYSESSKSYKEIELADKPTAFANKDHIYLLHLSASTFSNGTVDFQLDDDNTITTLKVNSTSTGEPALASLGTGVKNILSAQTARQKMEDDAAAKAATLAATGITTKEDIFVVAFDAKGAAIDAQLELESLPPTASTIDRQKAMVKAQKTRVLANQAARRAGIALPYPEEPFSG
jgi:hypothetical protein